MARTDNVVTLNDREYGYRSKAAMSMDDPVHDEIEQIPVVKIDEWLSPDAEKVTKWVKLPSRDAKVLIKAMSQNEFKDIRKRAPMTPAEAKGRDGRVKMVKDEDWIQTQVILENVVEPKITNPALLEHGLAGDVTFLVMEITRLSGFDVDKVMRDALEL